MTTLKAAQATTLSSAVPVTTKSTAEAATTSCSAEAAMTPSTAEVTTTFLTGGTGNDTIIGGNGSDTITGGSGNDTIDGGTGDLGIDTVKFSGARANYTVSTVGTTTTVTDNVGTDGEDTITNTEILNFTDQSIIFSYILTGQAGADTITGGSANDTLKGGLANDSILGMGGNDTIDGGGHNDIIVGGAGADTLTGGAGADIFRYTAVTDSTVAAKDTITDFDAAGVDIINLQGLQFGTWNGTILNAANTAFANTSITQIAFNDSTKSLQLDMDGNSVIDMEIILSGVAVANLDSTDFTFV